MTVKARGGWIALALAVAVGVPAAWEFGASAPARTATDAVPDRGASVVVVWRPPDGPKLQADRVDRADWQGFVASRRDSVLASRAAIIAAARRETTEAMVPVFAGMKQRVADYVRWFYSFPTTYRMAFTAIVAMAGGDRDESRGLQDKAKFAIDQMLRDRFIDVVVVPPEFGAAVEQQLRGVLQRAIARERDAAAAEAQALATFMAAKGGAALPGDGQPLVLAWEALGFPADGAAMAAPPDAVTMIKGDPALTALRSSAGLEVGILVSRQIVRRVIGGTADDAMAAVLMPLIAGTLGPAEAVVAPALGILAFAMGIGAEFGTVIARHAIDGDQLTTLCDGIVDTLHQAQSQALTEAVSRRLDSWLAG
ncbi:MAG: hypothetical protein GC191_05570 [Azospirillum sp.]|nr:hypothetical protein [Azospirillum sp.]